MKTINEIIEETMNIDPIQKAEDFFIGDGNSDEVQSLGLLFQMGKSKLMDTLMELTNDTKLSGSVGRYLEIAKSIGFEVVLMDPFKTKNRWDNDIERNEFLFVLYHYEYGILLSFTTYNTTGVNGGHFYYNITPKEGFEKEFHHSIESGGYSIVDPGHIFGKKYVGEKKYDLDGEYDKVWGFEAQKEIFYPGCWLWVGHNDCREGLKYNIEKLAKYGDFQVKWKEMPFLWLVTYTEEQIEGYDYKKITDDRLCKLPDKVLENILGI